MYLKERNPLEIIKNNSKKYNCNIFLSMKRSRLRFKKKISVDYKIRVSVRHNLFDSYGIVIFFQQR